MDRLVLSAGFHDRRVVLAADDGRILASVLLPSTLYRCAIHPNNAICAVTGQAPDAVYVLALPSLGTVEKITGFVGVPSSCSFSPCGTWLATGDNSGEQFMLVFAYDDKCRCHRSASRSAIVLHLF